MTLSQCATRSNFKHRLIITALFMMGLTHFYAQKPDKTAALYGEWNFQEAPSFAKIPSDIKEYLDESPDMKNEILSKYSGRKVFFEENGTYRQLLADGKALEGTWSLLDDDVLLITDGNGNTQKQRITLNQAVLILHQVSTGDSRAMLPEQHFRKN